MYSFSNRFLPETSSPRVEPFGLSGGFTIIYPDCGRETLLEVRKYQQKVRAESPGWMSRLDYDGAQNRCKLHVFPQEALPYAVLAHPNRYGTGR